MGGHSSGEVASRMAVDILAARLRSLAADPAGGGEPPPPDETHEAWLERQRRLERRRAILPRYVEESLRIANQAIFERGAKEQGIQQGRSMGTTLALLCIAGESAVVAHVGDSRIYRVRDGAIELLTRDHSVTAPEFGSTARSGRKRKYVTRALGTRAEVAPDLSTFEVRAGDVFVACSDGLTDHVKDEEIAEAVRLRPTELQHVPTALVNLANERGGRDNITVVLAEAQPDPTPAPRPSAPPSTSARAAKAKEAPLRPPAEAPTPLVPSAFDGDETDPIIAPPPFEPPPIVDSADLEELV